MSSNRSETDLQKLLKVIPEPKTSRRMDCPSCGGSNTFSITNLGTIVLFYCFKASCKLKGKQSVEISLDSLKKEFKNTSQDNSTFSASDSFLFIPETLGRERINNYLHKNNCWDAYREGRADIRYDPHEDRVVFMIWCIGDHEPVDAIGRKLSKGAPKWKRYGKSSNPFICPKELENVQNKTLIIVEDCCSACAASSYADSAALLGTSLQASYLKEFLQYDNFILALDKDASKLAFNMQRELQYYRPTKILLLTEDLKSYNPSEIRKLFDD